MRMFQRVLVALDQEDRAEAPLRFAYELAQNLQAELIVFHAISWKELEDREELPPPRNYVDVILEDSERDLAALAHSLEGHGEAPAVRALARSGDAAEEILRLAAEEDCDLIVIGLRRRSKVGKFLLGSNLQDILMTTERPVIAVPIEGEDGGAAPAAV